MRERARFRHFSGHFDPVSLSFSRSVTSVWVDRDYPPLLMFS
jgi:hypothetical protein